MNIINVGDPRTISLLAGFIGMALVMIAGLSATLYSLKHKQ